MNLTDNEIIKALERLHKRILKSSFAKYVKETEIMGLVNALDLINRLKATNELSAKQVVDLKVKDKEQQTQIERLHEVINGLEEQSHKELQKFVDLSEKYTNAKAEIERLRIEGLQINKTFMDFVNKQIAEAVKEFAERLIHEIVNRPSEIQSTSVEYLHGSAYRQNEIVDLVKEMVGEE